jgi:hypothetical protein
MSSIPKPVVATTVKVTAPAKADDPKAESHTDKTDEEDDKDLDGTRARGANAR